MKKKSLHDPLTRNIAYISALVFVLSLQVLIIAVFIFQFIPIKLDPITQGVPTALLQFFKPNRNHLFYHVFIASSIIGEFLALYLYRQQLVLAELAGDLREFLICESCWVAWQLFAVFKILQYDNPLWARILLYAGLAAALLAKIFWPELKRGIKHCKEWLGKDVPGIYSSFADGGIILLLFLVIMVPDIAKAISRIAIFDNNNHMDQWLMLPLWAYHQGLIPALQVFNPLNWGAVFVIHGLVNFIGGISYGHVVAVLCFLTIGYFIGLYYFLRSWLGILPAIVGTLMAVKLQMFHTGVSPLIWTFPAESVLRHLFDVAVFAFLLAYARGKGEKYLWLAAAGIGLSLGFVFDTGAYMWAALLVYLVVLLSFKATRHDLCPSPEHWRKILGLAVLPWLVMIMVLGLCFGSAIWHSEFWANSFKNLPAWLHGMGTISVFSCLKDRNFYAFFASFFPPLMYATGVSATISMVAFGRWKREQLFIVPMSAYGLGVYAHFLWQGTINYYYFVPLPLIACLCFWGQQSLEKLSRARQRLIQLIFVVLVTIALFTNVYFTYYPNILNLAQVDWNQQKAIYKANYNFDQDADFVNHMTLTDARVALISGFATQILMQADRKPYFYAGLPLMSVEDVLSVLKQLDGNKPAQVFVEKSVLSSSNPAPLSALTNYLKAHYQFSGQQSNMLALLQRVHE
jgi:hypothetical protein